MIDEEIIRENELKRNGEGYPDPTAYAAIKNIEHETKRVNSLLKTIFSVCKMAGFKIEGRIVLKDEKTGRIWR